MNDVIRPEIYWPYMQARHAGRVIRQALFKEFTYARRGICFYEAFFHQRNAFLFNTTPNCISCAYRTQEGGERATRMLA